MPLDKFVEDAVKQVYGGELIDHYADETFRALDNLHAAIIALRRAQYHVIDSRSGSVEPVRIGGGGHHDGIIIVEQRFVTYELDRLSRDLRRIAQKSKGRLRRQVRIELAKRGLE